MTIRSTSYSQDELLSAIATLHLPSGQWYDADITFGNGSFWKNLPRPQFCSDLSAASPETVKADAARLPLRDGTLSSVVVDLPFLTYVRNGREHKAGAVTLSKRFSGYWSYPELARSYQAVLKECSRVLRPQGICVFKCQDIVHNHQLHPTHVHAIAWAAAAGLRLLDLFVLTAKHRMPSPQKGTQRHARVFHSYFLVFTHGTTAGALA